ncbi:MAG: molybdate ABC transporter substrate-binding protein [Candidatus Limnocylindrales bacterium]
MNPRTAVGRSRLIHLGFAVALALPASLAACTTSQPDASTVAPGQSAAAHTSVELTVFGAASLKNALEAVGAAYGAAVPGITLTIATDSSATLRTQIEQGAPADLFLSADQKQPQTLADAGLTDGPPVVFAASTLTLIVPADNPAGIHSPADLARPGVKVVAAGADVPIARYADQVVARLGTLAGYPARFADDYAANVVTREQNVQAVVAKIELGEGDAAIVYVTDARASGAVATIPIPDAANVPATYAGVVVAASTRREEAHALLDWLAGPPGASVLATFGFLPPP